jgi:hypothetical protein
MCDFGVFQEAIGAGGVTQVVEYLPIKYEDLSSNQGAQKSKNKINRCLI